MKGHRFIFTTRYFIFIDISIWSEFPYKIPRRYRCHFRGGRDQWKFRFELFFVEIEFRRKISG